MYNFIGRIHEAVREKVSSRLEVFDVDEFVEYSLMDEEINEVIAEVLLDEVDLADIAKDIIREKV